MVVDDLVAVMIGDGGQNGSTGQHPTRGREGRGGEAVLGCDESPGCCPVWWWTGQWRPTAGIGLGDWTAVARTRSGDWAKKGNLRRRRASEGSEGGGTERGNGSPDRETRTETFFGCCGGGNQII